MTEAQGRGTVQVTVGKGEIPTGREKGQYIINTVQKVKGQTGEETTVPLPRGRTEKTHLTQTEAGGAH